MKIITGAEAASILGVSIPKRHFLLRWAYYDDGRVELQNRVGGKWKVAKVYK